MDLTFEITEQVTGGVPVVSVAGEIDVATAPTLRDHLAVHEEAGAGRGWSWTCSGFPSWTRRPSACWWGSFKRIRESGGDLKLVIAEPRILKVFEITDLVRVFSIFSTVGEALQDE